MSEIVVQFLTRPSCHLCEEARAIVDIAVRDTNVTIEEVDIDLSSALTRDYGLRIPVALAPNGAVLAEGEFDQRRLRRQLRKLASTSRRR